MTFSNKSVEKISKFFWKSLFFNDCENHSGCPNGRLGASRTSSSGNGLCHDLETEIRNGDEPYYASNKARQDDLIGSRCIAAGGGRIWVLNEFGSSLTELDASNGNLVRVIHENAGDLNRPENVVYRDGDVWVVNGGSNSVSELDAATGKLLRNLS